MRTILSLIAVTLLAGCANPLVTARNDQILAIQQAEAWRQHTSRLCDDVPGCGIRPQRSIGYVPARYYRR